MENREIIAIFNEKLKEVFSAQEDKFKRKKLFEKDTYFCTEEEMSVFSKIFEELLEKKDDFDKDSFLKMLHEGGAQ